MHEVIIVFLQVIGMLLFGWRHLFFWVQFVVWWAPVAAAAEYRYFGELFLFLDVLVVLQYFMIGVFLRFLMDYNFPPEIPPSKELQTRARRTSPLLVFPGCLAGYVPTFSSATWHGDCRDLLWLFG